MKQALTLSIVIPAYNEEHQIAACLKSISEQSVAPLEVILVDNNSTDETAKIAGKFPFVRVIEEKRQGIVFARNTGFDAARGDIIGRIDADSVLPRDWVEQILNFYADPAHERIVFTADAYFYNLHTTFLTSRIYNFMVHTVNRWLLGYHLPWGSNTALPLKGWEAVKSKVCLRTDIHEDLDLGMHLTSAGFKTIYKHTLRVQVEARRITSERGELWHYLSWWPNTFKVHKKKQYLLVWPLAVGVWLGSYSIFLTESFLNLFNRQKPAA